MTNFSYLIQRGDTLSSIAKKQGTTIKALLKANPKINDPNKIVAGQSLNVVSRIPTPKDPRLGGALVGATTAIPGFAQTDEVKKARALEILRGQQGEGVGKAITKIPGQLKDIFFSDPARLGAGAYLQAKGEGSFVPTTKLEKFVMGDKPVAPLGQQGEETLSAFGVSEEKAEKYGLPVGIAFLGLEFIPAGKGTSKILSKTDDVVKITKTLKKAGLAEEAFTPFIKTIAKETDPKAIEKTLAEITQLQTKVKPTRFAQRVKDLPSTAPEVSRGINSYYTPQTNKALVDEARTTITKNPDEAFRIATSNFENPSKSAVYAQELIVDFQKAGRYEEAINLVENVSKRAKDQGQAIQTLSLYEKLTPEGILRATQRMIDQANVGLKPSKMKKLSAEAGQALVSKAKTVKAMSPGRAKTIATAQLVGQMAEQVPVSNWSKVATIQTMAQLLNPKTAIRNIVGNLGFQVAENVSQVPAHYFDSALSLFTKKKTIGLPNIKAQVKGFASGLAEGVEDAFKRVDTANIATRFDLPKTGVFKGKVGRTAETLLNLELKAPDRAFYKSAYDSSIAEQILINKSPVITDSMIEIAHHTGLYRTFQDDNVISGLFTGFKKNFNRIGFGTKPGKGVASSKEFGLGDFTLKYPKTPGNLLARGIDYSPGGFVNSVYQMAQPLVGKPFNQRAFVNSFSRALVGSTGLVGTGAMLKRIGIISGSYDKDKDVRGIERTTGLGQYKINVDALKRFVMSGLDVDSAQLQEGDKLISYDWFQPMAIAISIGANLEEGRGEDGQVGDILSITASGLDTLGEQPLMSQLQKINQKQTFSDSVIEILKGIPSSFVPTIVSQVNQLIDNTQRNSYSPSEYQYAFNLAKAKIPGLAQSLPPAVDVWGDDLERYQGESNNVFNVFFNPAFKTHYKTTPEAELVLDLLNDTGEAGQLPRVVDKSVTINGEKKTLTPQEITDLQRFVGTATKQVFSNFASMDGFQELPPEEKIKILSSSLTSIMSAGKISVLGDIPKSPSKETMMILLMTGGLGQ